MWPANLDGGKSKQAGRKLPLSKAVKQPSLKEIAQAATTLGFSPESAEKASSPRIHWEKHGNMTVKKSGSRQTTLKSIAIEVLKARQREAQAVEPKRERR